MTAAASTREPAPARLVSLDAYRGFVMLMMVLSPGGALNKIAETRPGSRVWEFITYQFEHVAWTGCSAWDLIQPSFMFIVGVAMPYSYAARQARGDSEGRMFLHVVYRAFALILLGVFLRSNGREQTNWTFEDVLTQIGLGYVFVYLLLGRALKLQAAVTAGILIGYWLLFALWPLPGPDFNAAAAGIPDDWKQFTGFAAHWNKHVNPANHFDQWFLNLFPRKSEFVVNGGGYMTLNFIPSMGTMLFGVMAGQLLRSERALAAKARILAAAGLACLAFGLAVDGHIWPFVDWTWSIAPIVKRIWTPSWAVFSTGWTLISLALFVWAIDMRGWKRLAFPCVVVGMNSIAIYCMSSLWHNWIRMTTRTHLGSEMFDGTYGPLIDCVVKAGVLWLVCYWMYRKRIFIRI